MGYPHPYPLGLAKGSVRATITLFLSLDLALLAIQNSVIADRVATMTVVSLTFYFGGKMRNSAPLPRNTDSSLRAWGLPAGTIRSMLIFIFSITAGYLYFIGNGIPNYLLEVMNIILGYLGGKFFTSIRNKLFLKSEEKTGVSIVDHLKSLLALGITISTVYYTIFIPGFNFIIEMILTTSIILGFYFGARE